jgi:hypothetical protein
VENIFDKIKALEGEIKQLSQFLTNLKGKPENPF